MLPRQSTREHPAATALLALMEDISETHYCAGWMSGLEFRLWEIAHLGADPDYGMFPIGQERVASLRWLSNQAGGWWRWDAKDGETFVSFEEWRGIYAKGDGHA